MEATKETITLEPVHFVARLIALSIIIHRDT